MSFWLTLYYWFRDQGSTVAGGLALIAGAGAYYAGELQARATREAANSQKQTFENRANELGRRERRNLTYLLSGEVSRIKMEAEFRYQLIQIRTNSMPRTLLDAAMREPYKIVPREIIVSMPNAPNLLRSDTCKAIITLLASVDQMNTQLEIRTQLRDFYVDDFMNALLKIGGCADTAIALLAEDVH